MKKDNEIKYLIVVLLDCFDVGLAGYTSYCLLGGFWKSLEVFADQQIRIERFQGGKSRLTVLR